MAVNWFIRCVARASWCRWRCRAMTSRRNASSPSGATAARDFISIRTSGTEHSYRWTTMPSFWIARAGCMRACRWISPGSSAATWRLRCGRPAPDGAARARGCQPGRSGRYRGDRARLLQQLLELTVAIHLERDIAAADQLAVDVQLRVGRPVRVTFERLAQFRIVEDIDVMKLGAKVAQRCDRLGRKSALRKVGVAFHEQHHRGGGEFFADPIVDIHRNSPAVTCTLNYGGRWPILQTAFLVQRSSRTTT